MVVHKPLENRMSMNKIKQTQKVNYYDYEILALSK